MRLMSDDTQRPRLPDRTRRQDACRGALAVRAVARGIFDEAERMRATALKLEQIAAKILRGMEK
jgi:hypothetical protein